MFSETAGFYDLLYSFKDYEAETRRLLELVEARLGRAPTRALDAACGTGLHLRALSECCEVEGFDLDEGMLEQARRRLPGVPLHRCGFEEADFGRRFDLVTCLFSSIAYVGTPARLDASVASLARHLVPGGLLVLEPWISPDEFRPGSLHVHSGQDASRAVTRMATARLEDRCSVIEMQYLLGDQGRIRHAVERHVTALFTDEEHRGALERAGLVRIEKDPVGLMGRGLWLAAASQEER